MRAGSADESMAEPHIVRRLGSTPTERGSGSATTCPDVFLMSDGSIAYIGTDMTERLRHRLPEGAGIGGHERLVVLPLRAVLDAMGDIQRG